jgi:mannose-6-phosphate isomerase-like protein (cupin superfamily)
LTIIVVLLYPAAMTLVSATTAPRFDVGGTHVIGLASPSRGAAETSVWRLTLDPGSSSPEHTLDREEVFVALAGTARAVTDGHVTDVRPGDALIVPPAVPFTIANPGPEPFEAVVSLPVGGSATVAGEAMTPPWAV